MLRVLRATWVLLLAVWLPGAAFGALQDLQGNPRSLDDYLGEGKWTVVMIWASDCHVCNAEAHQYVDFHTFHQNEARVLGISMDGPRGVDDARAFIKRHNVNFPNLIGDPAEVAGLFTRLTGQRWVGTPTFLIFDPSGTLRAQQVGAVPQEVIAEFIASDGQ